MSARPSDSRELLIGIDAGGTGTRAVLVALDGTVLGSGSAGPANVNTVGLDAALAQALEATRGAWASAGLPASPATSAFIGAAGLRASGSRQRLIERFQATGAVRPGHCDAAGDTESAHVGALAGSPGITLMVGTGSFCLGSDASGRRAECGGWGWLLDDVGGGAFLGIEALKAAVRALDGRSEPTSLGARITRHTNLPDVRSLPALVQRADSLPTLLASLAPLVLDEARAGDSVAGSVLARGAAGLAELAVTVSRSLAWQQPPVVAITGGLGRSGEPYQPLVEAAVLQRLPSSLTLPPRLPPVGGAALLAARRLGWTVDEAFVETLRASLSAMKSP